MMRLVAAALVLIVVAFPLAVHPAAPVTWLVVAALLAAGAGVALLSVPVVTAGGALALIAHAVALLIARPALDPVGAIALGVTLTLLLSVVHFAARAEGAVLGPSVVASQVREWVVAAGLGVVAAAVLAGAGAALAGAFRGAALPMVIALAALGAAVAVAGAVALIAARREPRATR